jgi:thiol-disulfide isomerase/thioredoxin
MNFGVPSGNAQARRITYKSPNAFKIESERMGFVQVSVSDGKKLVEFSSLGVGGAMEYPAPQSIATAGSMQMGHPMFCGSLLYRFFAGPDGYDQLVDTQKGQPAFDAAIDIPVGAKAKVVTFPATGLFGNAKVAIDERTGLIHRIEYDSAELLAMMKNPELQKKMAEFAAAKAALSAGVRPFTTVESYSNHVINPKTEPEDFLTTVPKGQEVVKMPSAESPRPPVPLGRPAPDADLLDLDGKGIRLSSLKGKVVLIDFWATWCGPCRIGLPKTQELHNKFAGNGLAVLAVSTEEAERIRAFMKENSFILPSYRDPDHKAHTAYGITSIPTLVVIDRGGNLVSYMVGLQSESAVLLALKKAGIPME